MNKETLRNYEHRITTTEKEWLGNAYTNTLWMNWLETNAVFEEVNKDN